MTDSAKARRAVVQIGSLFVDGFMLPDGSYRMSQASAADAIEEPPVYALRFLGSKDGKALLGEGFTDYTPESVEVQSDEGLRGQSRINALPLRIVATYWAYRSHKGNRKAFLLTCALLTESLERRFDTAFDVSRTEEEWNARLAQQVQELERDLTRLGEAYAMEDEVRDQLAYLERWLQERGLNPWEQRTEEQEESLTPR